MSVHYKFKSALEYDTVTFDGLHISVRDLKNAIMQQKRIGKNTDFDLQVTNAQTKEVYDNEEALIPKNTSLLIARIPSVQTKPKTWEGYGGNSSPVAKVDDGGPISKAMDLSSLDASEEDKIKAMMSQSTQDYDPSNYLKIRGANQMGTVPSNYRCFKCHQGGHWIKDCPLSQGTEPIEIKKSTGIPRSFMVPVEGPQVQGAMMTPNGSFAVPVLDHQAYTEKPQPAPPEEKQPEIPEDLLCSLCSDLLTDAVMIPCCGDSYCDECIRSCLLESEDHECPACHERDISPGTLIPNRYLRNSVANFKSSTGYVKRLIPKLLSTPTNEQKETTVLDAEIELAENKNDSSLLPATVKTDDNEKTVIREADSTEPPKQGNKEDFTQDIDLKEIVNNPTPGITEGPPGVSPRHEFSPKAHPIMKVGNAHRSNRSHKMMNSHDKSPRRQHHIQQSPTYQDHMSRNEDRPGTPTVDEPGHGICSNTVYSTAPPLYNSGPPPNILSSMMGMPPPNMQGPPPSISNAFPLSNASYPPPNQGPLPNFRLPPPGAPPFIQGGYSAPPRPIFDCSRPPLSGQTGYVPYSSGSRSSRSRDYSRDLSRRGRTPPRIIDDPLEAFNRMLREKDERERRAKQRKARSYSRSSSRSFSRSPRRQRSRSPRRRTRSRSRSFSISRSRSRSFSPTPRTSPPRQYSPKRSPHRRAHSRFRSPVRSPLPRYRYKEQPMERDRGRDREMDRERDREKEFRDRERERENRGYSRDRERDFREREPRDRDYTYYDSGYDRDRQRGRAAWGQSRKDYPGPPDAYYHQPDMTSQPPPFVPTNRYPPRDVYPHHLPPVQHSSNIHPVAPHLPPMRRYDDVAPPGTEQPPIPGMENTPRFDDRYPYDRSNPPNDSYSPGRPPRDKDIDNREIREDGAAERERRHDRYSRSPDRNRYSSPRRVSRERDREHQAEKHKRRRRDDSTERDRRDADKEKQDRKRDLSDDERSKKYKEKKRKKDKKERKDEERKKRKEKKEKKEQDKLKKTTEEKDRSEKKKDETRKDDDEKASQKTGEVGEKEEDSKTPNHPVENYEKPTSAKVIENEDDENKNEDDKIEVTVEEDNTVIAEAAKSDKGMDLYGDLLTEDIDNAVIQNYGKIKTLPEPAEPNEKPLDIPEKTDTKKEENTNQSSHDEGEITDGDDSEKDILELHTNEAELKTDIEVKSEVLVPLPERSKWEIDEDAALQSGNLNRIDSKSERSEKSGKVTNEVLKRAENAIFAKAINAIRPIEIKKISLDRVKLYSGERSKDKKLDENFQIFVQNDAIYDDDVVAVEAEQATQTVKPRLSVKERLGCKVDDIDRIVKIDKPYERNRSHSLSPLSRRANELSRNLGQGERRTETEDRKRDSRFQHGDKGRDHYHRQYQRRDQNRDLRRNIKRDSHKSSRRERDRGHRKEDAKKDEKKVKVRSRSRGRVVERTRDNDDKKSHEKRKSSKSRSRSPEKGTDRDRRKRRDKKEKKKEKSKRHTKKDDDSKESETKVSKNEDDSKDQKLIKTTTDKRKTTLDEASFEPDYDLETESEKDDGKESKVKKRSVSRSPPGQSPKKRHKPTTVEEKTNDSSSSDSSDSSSENDKRKKKHRKHKKKRSRKDSSSSSDSESESESSEDDKDRKKKRHKKKQKKRKKSKHK